MLSMDVAARLVDIGRNAVCDQDVCWRVDQCALLSQSIGVSGERRERKRKKFLDD